MSPKAIVFFASCQVREFLQDAHVTMCYLWSERSNNYRRRLTMRKLTAGLFITSAGIEAGIDMSLHLVERLLGREMAETTARRLEYSWQENR